MKKATVILSTVLMTAMMLTSCGGIAKKESTTTNKESSNEVTIGKQTSKAEIINGNIDSDTERNSSDFKLLSAQDSFNYYKNDYQNSIISRDSVKSNSDDYYKKEELGNLIIFYKLETKFVNGEPNEYWNGDYFEDIICTYFIKDGNSNRQLELQECFNNNVNELLSKINILAKKQFIEDKENVKQCGGNLKLPLKLNDLEMHVDSDFICFEYEVGLWKGNNCGLPRDRVCFEKELVKKYIKGF